MYRKYLILFTLLLVASAACTVVPNVNLSEEATAETTESAELAVDGAPPVVIDHFAGTVTVREGDPGRITATAVKQSRLQDAAEAQAQLERVALVVEETAEGARVAVDGPDGLDSLRDVPVGLTALLEVTVPPGSDLKLNLGAGETFIHELEGDVQVDSGAGVVTIILPVDASFNLVVTGGAANIDSDFEGVPGGGVAVEVETTVGSNPTQSITINLGAGDINLKHAP